MPGPVKKAFAGLFVGAGALLSVVGAAIAAKAGLVLLVIGIQAAGISFGGVLAVLLPAIGIVAAVALAVAGLRVAFEKNLGGIADFAERAWQRVSLFFGGLKQLVEDGGFSGAIREELSRADNAGLKDFLINLFLWGNRIQNFLAGIGVGFGQGIEGARPSIDAFLGALERLGTALGFLSQRDDATTASGKFQAFGSTGQRVGSVLAQVFDLVVQAMTGMIQVATGVASAWDVVRPSASMLGDAVSQLGGKLSESISAFSGNANATRESGSAWVSLGNVVGFAISVIVAALAIVVAAISVAVSLASGIVGGLMAVFSGLADIVTGVVFIIGGIVTGSWSDIWAGMRLIAFGAVDAIIGLVFELVGAIGGAVDAIAGLFGKTTQFQKSTRDLRAQFRAGDVSDFGVENLTFTPLQPKTPASGVPSIAPASAPTPAAAAAAINAPVAFAPSAPANGTNSGQPVIVNVQIDGQVVARAVHKAGADTAGRSFSPVPAY
jgi:hypothetical protein